MWLCIAGLMSHAQKVWGVYGSTDDCAALVAQADARHLADDPAWRHLLHYTRSPWGGVHSQARSHDFFVSPQGAEHPREELVALLLAVCPALLGESACESANAVRCQFPARYHFLAQRLAPATASPTGVQACPDYAAWQQRLSTASVSLVFAAGEMQRPSTLFGHAFLRLDGDGASSSELLAHAVSFTVAPSERNRHAFVAQALVGSLDAVFDVAPYYSHVQRYSDLQSRDLWTYRLVLSEQARAQLTAHLWEVRQTRFVYRFLDANCASALLELLDIAAPHQNLAGQLGLYAIPMDAVQIVGRTPRLWSEVQVRPALATRTQMVAKGLSPAAAAAAFGLADVDDVHAWTLYAALSVHERRAALRAADMLLRLRYGSNMLADARGETNNVTRRVQSISRAQVRQDSTDRAENARTLVAPHLAHRTTRMAAGFILDGPAVWAEWSVRAALHDLLDAPAGFAPWTALEVMHLQLRLLQARGQTHHAPVHVALDILRMTALRPFVPWAKPVSWRGALALRPCHDTDEHKLWASTFAPLSVQGQLGLGISLSPLGSQTQAYYGFVDAILASEIGQVSHHVLQLQAAVGGIWRWAPRLSVQAELGLPFDVWGRTMPGSTVLARLELDVGLQVAMSKRSALRLTATARRARGAGSVFALCYF